ncbi:hypothetical protein [Streptomyces sp. NPDC048357]|uniref:hypothetical protein n=1 Tax=Streptomyces sp. NPDC048357 TaxID=3154719 RepID=UPI00342E5C3E
MSMWGGIRPERNVIHAPYDRNISLSTEILILILILILIRMLTRVSSTRPE